MKANGRPLVALDVGSSKVAVLICERRTDGRLELRAASLEESRGFRKDTLVNFNAAVEAIRQAVEAAERTAGTAVDSAVIGVAGSHVRSVNSRGGIPLAPRVREVVPEDIRRAIEAARSVSLPPEQELLHVLPQEFLLDYQDGIRDPLGLLGRRLEVNVHIVTAAATATQNLIAAVNRAGLLVEDTVFEPLAAAEACLTPDERELGVVVVDIGGGSTDWLSFERGAPRVSGTIPVGGEHFTNDVAIGLRTPLWEAERLKRSYGCAAADGASQDTLFEVASMGERPARVISRRALCEILEPRAQEWLALLRDSLERAGVEHLPAAGVVLTGGAAQLEGLVDLGAETLRVPARLGLGRGLLGASGTLANPACAVAVGLILHANRLRELQRNQNSGFVHRLRNLLNGKSWAARA
ncbi:MAG: cell division protein FtsA [Acidobacteria bacterium]|nr:cell division protein FtsA [Acidobacteriota bacterium]